MQYCMDQEYVCAVLYPYMFVTVQLQAYDAIYMDSVLNSQITYNTENTIHHIH